MDESPNIREQRRISRVSDSEKPWRINAAPQQQQPKQDAPMTGYDKPIDFSSQLRGVGIKP
jgi:hypothetical protein